MTSTGAKQFWLLYRSLPLEVRIQARSAYRLFAENPQHPSLHFKRLNSAKPYVSARIGAGYRVVGVLTTEQVVWFWIGSHAAYDKILKQL